MDARYLDVTCVHARVYARTKKFGCVIFQNKNTTFELAVYEGGVVWLNNVANGLRGGVVCGVWEREKCCNISADIFCMYARTRQIEYSFCVCRVDALQTEQLRPPVFDS